MTSGELALSPRPGAGRPKYLFISGVGDNVFVAWEDGHLVRINTLNVKEPRIVEEIDLLEKKPGLRLTSLQFLIGKATLLAGDSTGRVRVWFRIRPAGATTSDHAVMAATHEFPGRGAAATAIAVSDRDRMFAVGYADVAVTLFYTTSDNRLADLVTQTGQAVSSLALAPKANGLIAETSGGLWHWDIDEGHPEVNFHAVLRPVWYEGLAEAPAISGNPPAAMTPSSRSSACGRSSSAPSRRPFIPCSSACRWPCSRRSTAASFLHPSVKAVVKPTIELMASLPSVVLGFLAGLVFAPFVDDMVVPAVLAGFLTIPVAFLVGGLLWQLLPDKIGLASRSAGGSPSCWPSCRSACRRPRSGRTPAGAAVVQRRYQGVARRSGGSAASGWLLLLLPVSAVGDGHPSRPGGQSPAAPPDASLSPSPDAAASSTWASSWRRRRGCRPGGRAGRHCC